MTQATTDVLVGTPVRPRSEGITTSTRPTTLDEIVGMEHNKQIIKYHVGGSKKLNDPIPSFVIIGPAGCGKSTLAGIIAEISQGQVHKYMGSEIKSPDDIYQIATEVNDGDVVYIEEAHTIGSGGPKSKICQSILYEWIEDFKLTGGGSFGVVTARKVSFVFATTDPGKLTSPLRSRCQTLHVSYYTVDQIKEVLVRAGLKLGMNLQSDEAALHLLAQSSRGTPRVAVMKRLDMVRKVMAEDDLPWSLDTVKHFMNMVGINEWGLEPNDILYCKTLYTKMRENANKPVSRRTMEQSTGFTDNMIESIIEAYLNQIGAIRIERFGRVLTPFGLSLVGATNNAVVQPTITTDIDLTRLRADCSDPAKRKAGMRGLMAGYQLKYLYPADRERFKDALLACGFIAKRRVGIVPIQ